MKQLYQLIAQRLRQNSAASTWHSLTRNQKHSFRLVTHIHDSK